MIPYLSNYKSFLLKNLSLIRNPIIEPIESCMKNETSIYIKHDVECKIESALQMSEVEYELGVSSIWLFQKDLLHDDNLGTLQKMIDYGHVIGYHYDVLDFNNGNFQKAFVEFQDVVQWFSSNLKPLRYVCPHGNPSKIRIGYNSNKDFWIRYSKHFDSLYDLVMDYSHDFYSDVSYGFYKIERSPDKHSENAIPTKFMDCKFRALSQISIHSHRWSNSMNVALFNYYRFKVFKFIYRYVGTISIVKILMNKFYSISRKV